MSTKHSIALTAIAAALALPASMEPAHAAVVGSFDPAFGPSIPNLGFKGQITMELSAGCAGKTGYVNVDPVGYGIPGHCEIKATSAYIDFYNSRSDPTDPSAPPATPSTTILATQNLYYYDDYYSDTGFGPSYIYGAYFDPLTGMLDGIDTGGSSSFQITVTDNDPDDANYPLDYNSGLTDSMTLSFSSGHQQVGFVNFALQGSVVQSSGSAFLNNYNDSGGTSSGPAGMTFLTVPDAVVPEPDSIALAGLGLAALIASRRRKKGAR